MKKHYDVIIESLSHATPVGSESASPTRSIKRGEKRSLRNNLKSAFGELMQNKAVFVYFYSVLSDILIKLIKIN